VYDNINPYVTVAHIAVKDRDYNVHISVNTVTHQMHVFKYNETQCQYEILDNQRAVQEFLDRPLHSYRK
jgi:hypothetical protein